MNKAVVVGINAYPQPLPQLEGCINDGTNTIAYLSGVAGIADSDITPLYDGRATKQAIVGALQAMIASSSPGDSLFFHYSGHGAQVPTQDPTEPDGVDDCMCPYDFSWSDSTTAFTGAEFGALLATLPDGVAFTAVLDCCHAGTLSRDVTIRSRWLEPPPDIAFLLRRRQRTTFRTAAMATTGGGNWLLIEACGRDETAADWSHDGTANGAFTYNWLNALKANSTLSVNALLASIQATLNAQPFNMHPQTEGYAALAAAPMLCTPPPVARSITAPSRALVTPDQIVFDESWTANVLGQIIGVELEILVTNAGLEFQLSSTAGLPLRWRFLVSANTTQQCGLGLGFNLVATVSGWQPSPGAVHFILTIQVAPPRFPLVGGPPPVTIVSEPVSIPIVPVERSLVVPPSAAELLAMIQLAQLGLPTKAPPAPSAVLSRDGSQWTGSTTVGFSGGLFGTSSNANDETWQTTIPAGFIRDHIEVSQDPPNAGNVHFNKWLDSDPHTGAFEYHIGCAAFKGGVATFSLHCVPDPAVTRQIVAPTAPATSDGNGTPASSVNGLTHKAEPSAPEPQFADN